VVLIFDGDDEDALQAARRHWTSAKAAGATVTYWQLGEDGRWSRKG